MRTPEVFDYNQPSPDTLTGIYVEVNDSVRVVATVECLFGITLTVDDEHTVERMSQLLRFPVRQHERGS